MARRRKKTFDDYPFLKNIKPKEGYIFHSDYFKVDGGYACILNYFHKYGSKDNFGAFYGTNKYPVGLPDGVSTINFEQVSRKGEDWIASKQLTTERIFAGNEANAEDKKLSEKLKANQESSEAMVIASELNNGASYLYVQSRLLIKAPTLKLLEESIFKIEMTYKDRFGSIVIAPHIGEQRRELRDLFDYNDKKTGKGFYFTSTEYAGGYNLVTHGLEDPSGEYVGDMTGDINTSAVLFDVNDYNSHIIVASGQQLNRNNKKIRVSDMWASKIGQSAMMNNNRVVHLVMNGCDMSKVSPEFGSITSVIDLNRGDVNMFEMFGSQERELDIFSAQMKKLILMAEQAYNTTDSDRSIIRGNLEKIATDFYTDKGMWVLNAKEHRDKLRIVNIPHKEVPKLESFVSYLDMEYKSATVSQARDDDRLKALSTLAITFRNLLNNNGDLFNTTTTDVIDDAVLNKRVIYDFSKLILRGKGIAMAQLVNVIGFAVGSLGDGDTLIIHGSEFIDESVREYITEQFDYLSRKGARIAFCYDSVDKMLDDKKFNSFDKADYTIMGNMTSTTSDRYQSLLGKSIPNDLAKLITTNSNSVCYIRRGYDNVVFRRQLTLFPNRIEV